MRIAYQISATSTDTRLRALRYVLSFVMYIEENDIDESFTFDYWVHAGYYLFSISVLALVMKGLMLNVRQNAAMHFFFLKKCNGFISSFSYLKTSFICDYVVRTLYKNLLRSSSPSCENAVDRRFNLLCLWDAFYIPLP